MPSKIIPLGPFRRDGNFYDMSGEGKFLLEAYNVSPVDGGYTGPIRIAAPIDIDDGPGPYGANNDMVEMALATESHVYAATNLSGGDKLLRADATATTWEDATGVPGWSNAAFGGSLVQFGDYIVAVNQNSG
jgi:hypothetical protein